MLGLFKSLKQKVFPSYLGVDIGTTSIKIVEVKQGKQAPALMNYGILQSSGYLLRANDVLQTSSLKLFAENAVDLLRMVLEKMKPTTSEATASLPIFSVFTSIFEFPEMSQIDLEKSLTYQARQYVPLPISEVAIDWIKVGEREDERGTKLQQVLMISVPQELIKKYQYIFKKAGLNLRLLEIESLSLGRSVVGNDQTPTIVVDIGSHSTNIAFFSKGQLKFSNQSDYGGSSLTQALASSLNVNPLRAEELKKEHGIINTGPNYELSTIMLPFLDVIISEIKKAEFNYKSQFLADHATERLIISGGGANLFGVEKYFEKEFSFPIVKAAPMLKMEYPGVIEPLVGELNPLLSVALGLTLKDLA